MPIESLVRPFQLDRISLPVRVVSGRGSSKGNVILRYGRGGSGKNFSGSYSYKRTRYLDRQYAEKSPFVTRGVNTNPGVTFP